MNRALSAKSIGCILLLNTLAFSQPAVRARPEVPVLPKGETQLFVDSVKIREKRGVTRVIHPAKKLESPVIKAEMPWEWKERNGVPDKRVNIYGTVLKDEKTGSFRMWYSDTTDLPVGAPIRLRFHLESGDLFSYRID